jgi:hypothetical protein
LASIKLALRQLSDMGAKGLDLKRDRGRHRSAPTKLTAQRRYHSAGRATKWVDFCAPTHHL